MSAIFGIISKKEQPLPDRWGSSMRENLRHRGPDGAHIWQDEGVVFGHLLMHTTPESCFEQQPLVYQHWVITADARLDNRNELFNLLNMAPSQRIHATDSLLLVKAFEKWGNRCPEFLVGDFAFAIWDRLQHSLYCAKDHTGVRQLFYYDSPDFFVFASEIRAIAEPEFLPVSLNLASFINYLIFLQPIGEVAEHTIITGIKRLMPARWLSWSGRLVATHLYWQPNPDQTIRFADQRDYGLALKALMEQAVDDRLRTNFPVGATLSGGLDSSSVASIAARSLARQGKNLYTASAVLPLNHPGVEEDERHYVNLVLAQEKNMCPTFVTAQGVGAFDRLTENFGRLYTPLNSFYYLDNALRQSLAPHTRVVLTGYMGDSTVSNRGTFVIPALVKQARFKAALDVIRSRKKIVPNSYASLLLMHVILPLLPRKLYLLLKKIKGTPLKDEFLVQNYALHTSFLSPKDATTLYKNQEKTMLQNNDYRSDIWDTSYVACEGEDSLSAYYQQEWAHPLMDKRIIDFLWASPPENFMYQGRWRGYIRRAMPDYLPQEILWRNHKTPYSTDFNQRLIDELPDLVSFLNSEKGGKINQYVDVDYVLTELINLTPGWKEQTPEDLRSLTVVHTGIQAIKYLQWFQANEQVLG